MRVRRLACLRAWIACSVLLGAGLTELGVVLPRRRRRCLRTWAQLGGGVQGWPGRLGQRGCGGLPQATATWALSPRFGHHSEVFPDLFPPSCCDLLAVVGTAAAGCGQGHFPAARRRPLHPTGHPTPVLGQRPTPLFPGDGAGPGRATSCPGCMARPSQTLVPWGQDPQPGLIQLLLKGRRPWGGWWAVPCWGPWVGHQQRHGPVSVTWLAVAGLAVNCHHWWP